MKQEERNSDNLIIINDITLIKMKHQITPWSIYDQQINNFKLSSHEYKNQQENKKLSLLPQQNFFAIKRSGPIKNEIACQQQRIEKGFNSIVILHVIRKELQLRSKDQLELPEIRHSVRVDLQKMRKIRPNNKNQSKNYHYTKDRKKGQPIENLNSQKSAFNVINYDPFNHAEIIQRGLIQIMKIRQKINKSQSKDYPSLNQI